MTKQKSKYKIEMSKECRRPSAKKDAVIKWIDGEYGTRKPTVEEFIKASRTPGTLLYEAKVLERNVTKAAEHHWREEAQYYLRHVNVVKINIVTREASPPVRMYIPIKRSKGGTIKEEHYVNAKRVMEDSNMTETVIQRAISDLIAWADRYERYAHFLDYFSKNHPQLLATIAKLRKLRETG